MLQDNSPFEKEFQVMVPPLFHPLSWSLWFNRHRHQLGDLHKNTTYQEKYILLTQIGLALEA